MAYILIENDIVIQKDANPREGFIEAPDSVVVGQIKQGDNYVDPELPPVDINFINGQLRHAAYISEADPLFFKWQRGESTKEKWLDKINDIKQRYPKEE